MANFQKYALLTLVVLLLSAAVAVDAFIKGIEGWRCLTALLDCEPNYRCIQGICRHSLPPA